MAQTAPSAARKPDPAASSPEDFSKEALVIEKYTEKITFADDGTFSDEQLKRIRVQSPAGVQAASVVHFYYASAQEDLAIDYLRVVKPSGQTVATPPENAMDMPAPITQQAPFYSDLKDRQLAVKGLEPGDTIEYHLTAHFTKVFTPGQFSYQVITEKQLVTLDQELEIRGPASRTLNFDESPLKPVISEEGAEKVYRWKTQNLQHTDAKQKDEASSDEAPVADIVVSTFSSWKDVDAWYTRVQGDRAEPTAEIRAKATVLTKTAKSDDEKIRLLYEFVSTQIRYVGVGFGIGHIQPHAAAEVLSNGYGDCKDKHTLLAALLAAIGVKAYPALVSTVTKVTATVPSPFQFDHMITALPTPQGITYLDTTAEVAPFGQLIPTIRGKNTLVLDGTTTALAKIPEAPAIPSGYQFHVAGNVDNDGTLHAKVEMICKGDLDVIVRAAFRGVSQAQWNILMQGISRSLGYNGTVSDTSVSAPNAIDEPIDITYDYERKDIGDWPNRKITAPFPPVDLPDPGEDKSAKPIKLVAPESQEMSAEITLPPGFSAQVPADFSSKESYASFQGSYSYKDGKLEMQRVAVNLLPEVPANLHDNYVAFHKSVEEHLNEWIVLHDPAKPTMEISSNKAVADLMDEARTALTNHDILKVENLARRATDMEPKYAEAWALLGYADLQLGVMKEGEDDLHKAIALNPKEPRFYETYATMLAYLAKNEEALQVWLDLERADPENKQARLQAGQILMQLGRYPEAAAQLEPLNASSSQDPAFQLALGQAEIRSGNEMIGMTALRMAMQLDKSPKMLNSVAYAMAVTKVDLPDALGYSQKSVTATEDATTKIDLDSVRNDDMNNIRQLGPHWDTLGWIYFQSGKLTEAEKYLRAAWTLEQLPVMGEHLGDVLAKEGHTAEAMRMYAQALGATAFGPDNPLYAKLVKMAGSKIRADQMIQLARSELGEERRSRNIPLLTLKEKAPEFFVMISAPDGGVSVKAMHPDETTGAAEKVLAAHRFQFGFPDDHPMRLLEVGVLVCEPGASACDFVLETPHTVARLDQ